MSYELELKNQQKIERNHRNIFGVIFNQSVQNVNNTLAQNFPSDEQISELKILQNDVYVIIFKMV